jgi:eukaryotic-like serine/threonine-protein kinase
VGRRWSFGTAVLDERSLELTVGGSRINLERKQLEVLLYLLHHAGEVVTKDELADNLWPGRILTESVLTRCISQLRAALNDRDRSVIRTVHGFGYRLVAEVKVDASTTPPPPTFTFRAGDHPPLRPQWRLVERLGAGGHGEAWLAQHDKTREARVFKFALDASALASLKREITLYRLMAETAAGRAACVQIFEWNLEEPPYFLETEYVAGRDLRTWAEAQGGLPAIPLEVRLEIIAQVAAALAAAHAVGVLHKDLKPGNVLVACDPGGPPRVRLADFGSGGVLDAARLEAMGITRLGFTQTAAHGAATGGTPLYLAPEVLAGQPFTVAADIYALGVMLYQVVVGDFRKTLAPGWEANVPDELLREDILGAAMGDPGRRYADPGQLEVNLRTLESRRHTRAADHAAAERAGRVSRLAAEARRAKVFALVLLVLALVAMAGAVIAYSSRKEALTARATAQAVNEFIMNDVLAVDPSVERPRDTSYKSLLIRAAERVGHRFGDQPSAAASLHWLLGRRFHESGHLDKALIEYERATALLPRLNSQDDLPALLALERLTAMYSERGRRSAAIDAAQALLGRWTNKYGPRNLSTLLLRARMARLSGHLGHLSTADRELRAVFDDLPRAAPLTDQTRVVLKEWLGFALAADTSRLDSHADMLSAVEAYIKIIRAEYYGAFAEDCRASAAGYAELLPTLIDQLGRDSEAVAASRFALAGALAACGRPEQARPQLQEAQVFFELRLPEQHWTHGVNELIKGRLELERQDATGALHHLEKALTLCEEQACSPRVSEEIQYDIARAHTLAGHHELAIGLYRRTLTSYELLRGPDVVGSLKRRLSLADALRTVGERELALDAIAGVSQRALDSLPAPHLIVAEFKRVKGLLAMSQANDEAQTLLEESLAIVEYRLPEHHWRTQRARIELARARARQVGAM